MLHATTHGSPTAPAVTLLHGFTQTGAAWATTTAALTGAGWRVVTVDAPGHGGSGAIAAPMDATADLLADTIAAHHAPGPVVGYSMGGRLALHLALQHPDLVTALVLVSATPGIENTDERSARRAADDALAAEAERDGIEAFLQRWLSLPMFATLAPELAGIEARRTNTAQGLAQSLRTNGTGSQASLWDMVAEVAARPTAVVAGMLDTKFSAIARRMATAIGPTAELYVMAGCGHACHLEAPERFNAFLLRFLAAAGGTALP